MKNHIAVEIFNILNEYIHINQSYLIRLLEQKGYKKSKSYIYLKYILSTPIPIKKTIFGFNFSLNTEPMLIRKNNDMVNNIIIIELNECWRDTDEKSVITLFNEYNPDEF